MQGTMLTAINVEKSMIEKKYISFAVKILILMYTLFIHKGRWRVESKRK